MIGVILGILVLWLVIAYPQIILWAVLIVCFVWFLALFPWLWLVIIGTVAFNLLMDM